MSEVRSRTESQTPGFSSTARAAHSLTPTRTATAAVAPAATAVERMVTTIIPISSGLPIEEAETRGDERVEDAPVAVGGVIEQRPHLVPVEIEPDGVVDLAVVAGAGRQWDLSEFGLDEGPEVAGLADLEHALDPAHRPRLCPDQDRRRSRHRAAAHRMNADRA